MSRLRRRNFKVDPGSFPPHKTRNNTLDLIPPDYQGRCPCPLDPVLPDVGSPVLLPGPPRFRTDGSMGSVSIVVIDTSWVPDRSSTPVYPQVPLVSGSDSSDRVPTLSPTYRWTVTTCKSVRGSKVHPRPFSRSSRVLDAKECRGESDSGTWPHRVSTQTPTLLNLILGPLLLLLSVRNGDRSSRVPSRRTVCRRPGRVSL